MLFLPYNFGSSIFLVGQAQKVFLELKFSCELFQFLYFFFPITCFDSKNFYMAHFITLPRPQILEGAGWSEHSILYTHWPFIFPFHNPPGFKTP